jgi:hypothetical protein
MRLSTLFTGSIAGLTAARSMHERAASRLVLSHYMVGIHQLSLDQFTNILRSLEISRRNMLTKILTMLLPWGMYTDTILT